MRSRRCFHEVPLLSALTFTGDNLLALPMGASFGEGLNTPTEEKSDEGVAVLRHWHIKGSEV